MNSVISSSLPATTGSTVYADGTISSQISLKPVEKANAVSASSNIVGTEYIIDIDAAALESSKTSLTDGELEDLYLISLSIGKENPLWEKISDVMDELTREDRTHFLSALAKAGSSQADFIDQVSTMDEDIRSVYLRTADRAAGENDLKTLVGVVKDGLPQHLLADFLETADSLGRTGTSRKEGELSNFLTAAAQADGAPAIGRLAETAAALGQEDRSNFLKAAAKSGESLNRLIDGADQLSGDSLASFLATAAKAGDGLDNLLELVRTLPENDQEDLLDFTFSLEDTDTQNFLTASKGLSSNIDLMIATAGNLGKEKAGAYFSLAAGDGNDLQGLSAMVQKLGSDSNALTNFLSIAIKAEDQVNDFLDITETIIDEDLDKFLSSVTDFSRTDLAGFIKAAKTEPYQAETLAYSALELDGKNRSYLLYAASLSREGIGDLTRTVRELSGKEQADFLFSAANLADESPDKMAQFIHETQDLSGSERADFLNNEKNNILLDTGTSTRSKTHVYLKAAYTQAEFDLLTGTGTQIEQIVQGLDQLNTAQRETFFTLGAKADTEVLPDLLSVSRRMNDEQSRQAINLSGSLSKEGVSDLIRVADALVDGTAVGNEKFNQVLETVQSLKGDQRGKFLNAARAAGENIGKLIEEVNQFNGISRTYFLVAADDLADRDSQGVLLKAFLDSTEYIYEADKNRMLENSRKNIYGVQPSQVIGKNLEGNWVYTTGSKDTLSDYLASAASLAATNLSNTDILAWYTSFTDH